MFQKKWYVSFVSCLLILAMTAVLLPAGYAAKAAEIQEVSVTAVDDIQSEAAVIRGASSRDYHTVYSFTLEKAAIVKVSAAESVFEYDALAGARAGVFRDAGGTAPVRNGEIGGYLGKEGATTQLWLEAGTYYVVFKVNEGSEYAQGKNIVENGETSVGVVCEYVDKSFSGNTKYEKAGKIVLNDDVTGMFTDSCRIQYYKFTLSKPSCVEVNAAAQKIPGTDDYYGRYNIALCDSDRVEIVKQPIDHNGTADKVTAVLNKGTYYVVMDAGDDQYFYGPTNLKVKANAVPKPAKPKVSVCRANTSAIKGTASAGATVYASYNGKKYKASVGEDKKFTINTPSLKKGKAVKVYVVKDFVKSNTKRVKVK